MRFPRVIPRLGLVVFGAAMAVFGLLELAAGRYDWAALLIVGAALTCSGIRLQFAADVEARWNAPAGQNRMRPLERAVQFLWAFAGGASMAFGVAQWNAGQPESGIVYLMCAGACILGLAVQLAAAYVFLRHTR